MADQPPLGHLTGMYYDHEKKRYFPYMAKPATAVPRTAADRRAMETFMRQPLMASANRNGTQQARDRKRGRREADLWDVSESPAATRRIRRSLGCRMSSSQSRIQHHLAHSTLCGVSELCECPGENITSIKSFGTQGICMTTDHGKLISLLGDREVASLSVCSQQIIGMHCDVARGTWVAVSNGNEPHIHSWRSDHSNPDHPIVEMPTIDFPPRDVFAMSSCDDMIALSSLKSLHIARLTESGLRLSRRPKLHSDPLALDHVSRDIVFAGLRSSEVVMEDLRVRASSPNIVATLPTTNRAVIGVKRLKDSAVPWGLAVSGMSNQLVLFDVRFPRQPLFELHGHVNTYHTPLALATSPDDTVLLAGGSDRRLRAWSTVTGERIQPPASAGRRNALTMEYRHYVQHIDVSEDLTLRVASAGDVLRFLPPRDTPRGRVKVG